MSYNPQNPNGQANAANSSPVVIASDQSAVPVSGSITANMGTTNGLALDATLTGGSQKTKLVDSGGTNVASVSAVGAVKVDGSAATQPVSGTVTVNAGTGNFGVNQTQIGGNGISTGNGVSGTGVQRVTIASDSTGQVALAAGSASVGTVGINAGSNTIGSVNVLPGTTGGWSVNSQTALTNTKVAVKASAGTFGGYMVYNPNSSVEYIQVFDVASGSVTLGSTTPTYVIPIPAAAAANIEFSMGINHATAITLAATTTATGSSAPASSLTGFFLFK